MCKFPRILRRASAVLACLVILGLPAFGQDPTTPVGLTPNANPEDMVGRLAFSDTALDSVLQTLETLTGRIVIRPQALPAPQLSLNARQPLTRAEAVLAIESLLSINGIGVVPLGDKFIKVIPIANIRTEAPELVVGTLLDQPASGKVVSKLFRLQYLDSASFQTQVAPFLSGFGTVVPFQNSNAVIVTDTIANLQRLEYVVSEVDRRINIETKFYQIMYATASELAQQIRTMIESARGSAGGTGGGGRAVLGTAVQAQPLPAPPGGAGAGGVPMQVVFSSATSINADDRTNQIIVISDPANLPFFDNMIQKLDVPADPPTAIEVIPMRHADAAELASLLSQFISGQSQSASQRSGSSSSSSRQRTTPFPGVGVQQAEPPGAAVRQRAQAQQQVEAAVQAVTGGENTQFSSLMTVIADERTNAIVVSGTNSDISLIKKVIEQLDVILAQVRIEVVIAEVTLDNSVQRGIDAFSLQYDDTTGEFGTTLNPGPGNTFLGSFGATVTGIISGGNLQDITIDAIVRSARSNSNVNLLSNPSITTTHNQEATIIVGEARPIVTSTQTGLVSGGAQYSSFQFQDIGIELTVTPRIGPNGVIQLEIDQKVDDIAGTVSISGDDQPIISRRQATSYLSVRDGQLIVLGGLQKNFINRTKTRMFLLGDIPALGVLFTKTNNTTTKTELLLFLKPTVLRNTDEADADARGRIRELKPSKEDAEALSRLTGETLGASGQVEEKKPVRPVGPR